MPLPHICDDCLMDVYLQTNLKVLVEKRMKKFVAVKVLFSNAEAQRVLLNCLFSVHYRTHECSYLMSIIINAVFRIDRTVHISSITFFYKE